MGLSVGVGALCFAFGPSTYYAPVQHVSFSLVTKHLPAKDDVLTLSTPPTRPPRTSLPLEIVLAILESSYYDSDTLEVDRSLLAACSLVSREWSTAAQRLLFHEITLRSQAGYESFLAALHGPKGNTLSDAIVRLRVIIDNNQPAGVSEDMLANAVALCPRLFELDLSIYGFRQIRYGVPPSQRLANDACAFKESTLAILAAGPTISSLKFNNWTDTHDFLPQLLGAWPLLESLSIGGSAPRQVPTTASPTMLRSLHMNFQHAVSADYMEWLLPESVDKIRSIAFAQDPSFRMFKHVLNHHGETLESISLPDCTYDQASVIRLCPNLRQITVEGFQATPTTFRNPAGSLEHIALGIGKSTPVQAVIDAVKSAPHLRAVTAHVAKDYQHSLLPVLQFACASRGIELRFAQDVHQFRKMIRGDSIATSSYPHEKTYTNIYAMRR
ncbi:hypothetical protein CYLTODRAFT_439916 [Cylindrobasidium torrendii FP15055 ss-10]|uniref:Uncharacterized protein n=1 Tax=Cylindrobasidium torrendii FP15055 ss-10 TaxID=1314674 RepID=A0A0D7BS45_9AGAR|nr:hypothetical protein CYLTODRAFT_439916 [Cylindrobasidium torrendii FP15055 ss-10]